MIVNHIGSETTIHDDGRSIMQEYYHYPLSILLVDGWIIQFSLSI